MCVVCRTYVVSYSGLFTVPSERLIVLRERASGAYYVSAYYVAKMLAEVAVQLAFPLLFSCIVYFLVGLQVPNIYFF